MKNNIVLQFGILLASFLAISPSLNAQGTFQNLNFEQANPVPAGNPYPSFNVTTASALPGWTVYYGSSQQAQVAYDTESLGATQVSLEGVGYGAIDGNYSVFLQGGITSSGASISQTGLIPIFAQSLLFEAGQPSLGPFTVSIGNQSIPFSAIGSGPNYTLFAANISAWAGDTEQLTFSALENNNSDWLLDDISFSPNAVPEPSTMALIVTGGIAFGVRQWRSKRS